MQIGRPGGSTPACSAPNTSRVQRKQTEGDTCVVLHSQGFLQRENLLSYRYLKRCAKSSNLAQKQSSYCIIKHLLYQHATGPSPFGFNFSFLGLPEHQALSGRPLPCRALQRHFVPQGGAAGRGAGPPRQGGGASAPPARSAALIASRGRSPRPPLARRPHVGGEGAGPVARGTAGRGAAAAAAPEPSRALRSWSGAGAEPGGPSPALSSARYRHRGATRARQPRGSGG